MSAATTSSRNSRRTAAIGELALDLQVVVNVNFEDQRIRAGRRLNEYLAASRAGG